MARNTLSRSLHDVGLAAWFGGTLANAIALNSAASEAGDPSGTGRVVNTGWNRWAPVNAVAIGAHIIGGIGQLRANSDRIRTQRGVAGMVVAKAVLTAAALGATAYSRVLGKKVSQHHNVPASSGTTPAAATPDDVAKAQQQLALLQWGVPALTGALEVISSFAGEQQRFSEVHKGVMDRILR
ncbi:hypothetical protein BH18ACT8_BH18ACT8_08560 [soil metagenome]